jgi:cation diffusion facilitator family transporter
MEKDNLITKTAAAGQNAAVPQNTADRQDTAIGKNTSAPVTKEKDTEFQKVANRVSTVSIVGNIILSLIKLFAGVIAHSSAMVSDAIHSASDVFSTIVVIIGIRLASKEADKNHPYGHERLECVAAILLSMVLFITGLGIGINAMKNILSGDYENIAVPGILALFAAILSILAKEAMFWYTSIHAKRIDSSALMADAWHHRSDAFSSVGALIGIAGARMGFPIMDSIASLVIFFFIVKASYDIFMDAVDKMVDHSCDEETEKEIQECILQHPDVLEIDLLQTRIFGNKIYADIEIGVDGSYSMQKAHEIAENVHEDIESNFPKIKHIMVHVNPAVK